MKSETTHTPPAERLDPNTLAALIEGRLRGPARDAALSKVAASADDLEILADAFAVSRELDGDVTDIRSYSGRTRARRPLMMNWMSAAAAAIILVASVPLMLRHDASPADGFASLMSSRIALAPDWAQHSWSATRGANDGIGERARGVGVGALTSTIDIAVARGDSSAANLAGQIASLLSDVPGAGDVVSTYRRLSELHGAIPVDQLHKARSAAREMVSKSAFDDGAWLEAARIAAVARDSAFFETKASRRQLADLQSDAAKDPRARDELVAVGQLIEKHDWEALSVATSNIIALLTTP
jgi:hypothetical protein